MISVSICALHQQMSPSAADPLFYRSHLLSVRVIEGTACMVCDDDMSQFLQGMSHADKVSTQKYLEFVKCAESGHHINEVNLLHIKPIE